MNPARGNGKLDGLVLLLLASQIFLVLSFLRLFGDTGSVAFGRGVVGAILAVPIWGTKLGAELSRFALTLVLLHVLLATLAFGLARLCRLAWPNGRNSQRALGFFWLALLMVWLLAANAAWYPTSSLGEPYSDLVRRDLGGLTLFSALSTVLLAGILTVLALAISRERNLARSKAVWIGAAACLAAGVALPVIDVFGHADSGSPNEQPHVIVIGIDSLRTDYVQNAERPLTPEIDRYLDGAVEFADAYTPLARTFPAWVSIVSGRHPHATGALVNLLPRELIHAGETLPETLRNSGYRTVYAIDEVRFSNLDESYGFDEMLAPPMGASDFMLGFFADTPLANVLVNTRIGEWLFPYGYANRAAAAIYNPDSFIERVDDAVEFDQPTLLAVHLTLVHWPYTWADAPALSADESASLSLTERAHRNYAMAVDRVDQQFGDLMSLLQDKGALDNAIVVVLSDHGESLGESAMIADRDDRIDRQFGTQDVFGHGTHVFSRDQYHVLLGMRAYGNELLPRDQLVLDGPVSLEDIAPTVLDMLDLGGDQRFDGRSLLPYVRGGDAIANDRIRYLETEFNPPDLMTDGMLSTSAVLDAVDTYEVDPVTDRVRIRADLVDGVLARRQYAAEMNGHMLAAFPAAHTDEQYLVYFDAESDSLSWLEQGPSVSDGPVVEQLWAAIQSRFPAVNNRRVAPIPDVADPDPGQ
jgi:arylsulfatase A-like enzyme